jgi:mannose-6-phosphate isomerase-like protein (cupin superfamily)
LLTAGKELSTTNREYPIHDIFIRPLAESQHPYGRSLALLAHDDHLLRRFGCAEWVRIEAGQARPFQLRQQADEIWVVLRGQAEASWADRRPGSPTRQATMRRQFAEPTLMLVPFGVAFKIRALDEPVTAIRFQSHSPREDPERPDGEAA